MTDPMQQFREALSQTMEACVSYGACDEQIAAEIKEQMNRFRTRVEALHAAALATQGGVKVPALPDLSNYWIEDAHVSEGRVQLDLRLNAARPADQDAVDAIPEELFDGVAVLAEITERERRHTGTENVIAVLDSVVRLIRKRKAALAQQEKRK